VTLDYVHNSILKSEMMQYRKREEGKGKREEGKGKREKLKTQRSKP
jgi:hypothetical protein